VRILRGELREAALEFEVEAEREPARPVVVTHQRIGAMPIMPHVLG
jgi:hypothetical protein